MWDFHILYTLALLGAFGSRLEVKYIHCLSENHLQHVCVPGAHLQSLDSFIYIMESGLMPIPAKNFLSYLFFQEPSICCLTLVSSTEEFISQMCWLRPGSRRKWKELWVLVQPGLHSECQPWLKGDILSSQHKKINYKSSAKNDFVWRL
jgi:hypothetical protein